ncbi:TraB/GumN family protein [Roseivivax sp. CAU 1753]
MRTLLAGLIWLTSAALALAPSLALAECAGTDLRPGLSDATRAEIAATVATMPYAEGNHWIARRDDQTVHLIGTMHVDDPRFDPIALRLRPVIAGARLLFLEATKVEQQALTASLAADPSLLVLQDTTLPELLGDDDWAALSEAAAARGIPGFMAAKMKPWYLSLVLALPPCMATDLAAANGLDTRLEALADALGTPTRALEDPRTVFAAFEKAPLAEQAAMILPSVMPPDVAEDMFATMRAAYFEEKPAESWALSTVLAARLSPAEPDLVTAAMAQTESALLHDRNRAWMSLILAELGPAPIVVAAGAAHLSGKVGLLALLEQQGFTLTRAAF